MGYASRSGRARTNPRSPSAFSVCDRCGIWHNLVDLRQQAEWFGSTLKTFNILVCKRCWDRPQENLRAIILPADPIPVRNPRVEYFDAYESDRRVTSGQNTTDPITGLPIWGGNVRITQNSNTRSDQATGEPPSGLNQTPGVGQLAVPDSIGESDPGLPYDYTQVPSAGNSK